MDPWNWTISDVVSNICHSEDLWSDRPNAIRPNSQQLEKVLRDNDINGAALLEDVDKHSLATDLGIKSLGQRSSIVHAITKLRAVSKAYTDKYGSNQAAQGHNVLGTAFQQFHPDSVEYDNTVSPANQSKLLGNEIKADKVHTDEDKSKSRRRRIAPQLQSSIPEPAIPSLSKVDEVSYRGPMSLDGIFYGQRQQGDALGDSDSDDEFAFTAHTPAPRQAQRRMVANRLKYSYLQEVRVLDSDRAVFYPYPERLVLPRNKRSATIIKRQDGKVKVAKCDAATLDDLPMGSEGNENAEWDFLIEKHAPKNDDEALPLYNESGSDGEYEGSIVDELEASEREKEQEPKKKELSSDQIDEQIHLAIEQFERVWREEKLPHRKRLAWKTWHQCQGRKRSVVTQGTRHEINRLEARLATLKRQVHAHTWTNPAEVRSQCDILEQTVSEKLDHQWKIELWTMDEPPKQPKSKPGPKRKTAKPPAEKDADESLDSESDHMDDFTENDDDHTGEDRTQASDFLHGDSGPMSIDHDSRMSNDAEQQARETIREAKVDKLPKEEDENMEYVPDYKPGQEKSVFIDLTSSSPAAVSPEPEDSDTIPTPPKRNPYPLRSTLSEIEGWTYDELEEEFDRKRLMLKMLYHLNSDMRRSFVSRIKIWHNEGPDRLERSIGIALNHVRKGTPRLTGLNDQDSSRVMALARLYLCWMKGGHHWIDSDAHVSDKDYEDAKATMKDDCGNWAQFLKEAIGPDGPFATDAPPDDFEEPTPMRRGKEIQKSQQGIKMRKEAQTRLQQDVSRRALQQSSPLQQGPAEGVEYIVNPNSGKPIYIHERVSGFLKPHQVEGVRFMWRELIDASYTDDNQSLQGCLLAHTMGLGKTLQSIALLLTLMSASMSNDPAIFAQIPQNLRERRALILCPAHLVENWVDEFHTWAGRESSTLGYIFDVGSQTSNLGTRVELIRAWISASGILIMSYEMFRNLTGGGPKKINTGAAQKKSAAGGTQKRKRQLMDEETQAMLRDWLLNGPSLVIADEAHRLKNQDGSLGSLVTELKTKSRIALTASPLSNNLREYFAMVNWIAPEYLGSLSEFVATYENPIQEGLYNDSTYSARVDSHTKLEKLKKVIEPKVSRADMTVLKDTLEPKTEFVVKVSLTAVQEGAYSKFLELIRKGEGEISNTRFWHWLALLGLLCVHPKAFYNKLEEYDKNGTYQTKKNPPTSLESAEAPYEIDEDLRAVEVSQGMYETFRDFFSERTNILGSSTLSHKLGCIAEILGSCKSSGERVLIFSHHLHNLRHLEEWVKSNELGYWYKSASLSGESKDRHKLAKDFNDGVYNLLFVSTRAGGTGINLQGASRVILMDLQFNPQHEEQAIGRAYRLGQSKAVYVYRLITCGTFEEELYKRAWFKRQLSGSVVDNKKMESRAARPKDYLFDPVDRPGQDLTRFKGTDGVLDAVLGSYVGSAIREIDTTDAMGAADEVVEQQQQQQQQREKVADTGSFIPVEGDMVFDKSEYRRGLGA